jgi:hypothetical protein
MWGPADAMQPWRVNKAAREYGIANAISGGVDYLKEN